MNSPTENPEAQSPERVYISYNTRNSEEAFKLSTMLTEAGIEFWIHEVGVLPGDEWLRRMQEAIETHTVFLILIGSADIGPSQEGEIESIQRRAVARKGVRIIPVLLPGAVIESVPSLLKSITWVDFREGFENTREFQRLLAGIRGIAPPPAKPSGKAAKKAPTKTQPSSGGATVIKTVEAKGTLPPFKEVGMSARGALNHADGIRATFHQKDIHMEHLIFALSMEENGPAQKLLSEAGIDEKKLSELIAAAGGIYISEERAKKLSNLTALPNCSGHVRDALIAASEIAKKTGAKRIESHHLLYGALAIDKCSLIAKLQSVGLRKENIELISSRPPEITIARLNSDDPDGDDLLNITKEVEALCGVLAAKDVTPPLSLGLFGDWGSGKSFFMRKMEKEIEELKTVARDAKGKSAFCPDIVQLKFNAWHYIDTNLWASLTSEIFEGLAGALADRPAELKDEKDKEYQRAVLIAEKAVLQQELTEAEEKKLQADGELEESERRLSELENDAQNIEANLDPKTLIWEVASFVVRQPEVKEKAIEAKNALDDQLGKAAKQLNIPPSEATTAKVQNQLLELRGNGSRLRAMWLALRNSKSRWVILMIVLAAAISITAVVLLMKFTQVGAKLAGVISASMSVVVFLSPYYGRALRGLNFIDDALKRNEEIKEEAKSTKRKSLERIYGEKQQNARDAQRELEVKSQKIKEKEAELQKLSINTQIATFIKQRSQSSDYTKYLGVISRARNDFEQLSILLEKEKQDAEAKTTLLPRIDRIILYIDDLDRCPEDKVVDVLQAVHLLLAFPLFIVVVGVDSRWLLHSLREHLKVFQNGSSEGEEMSKEERTHWQSTPLNYLEKIFQIPFTLRPMGSHGFGEMVDNLVGQTADATKNDSNGKGQTKIEGAELADDKLPASVPAQEEANAVSPHSPAKESSSGSVPPASGAKVTAPTTQSSTGSSIPLSTTASPMKPASKKREIDPNPQYLNIEEWECNFMKRLFEMIPSPRAAKRFINIYRLLRASVDDAERQYFIGNANGGKYRAALLLLAILTGYPAEATEILRALLEEERSETWWEFIESFRARAYPPQPADSSGDNHNQNGDVPDETDDAEIKRWGHLMRSLDKIREEKTEELGSLFESNQPCDDFVELAPQVARYSFQSGRVLLERGAGNNEA